MRSLIHLVADECAVVCDFRRVVTGFSKYPHTLDFMYEGVYF